MLFGRKNKKPSDRVLDLKARVDALRAADEATRNKAYSLDHFLEGDDVLTGREVEDDYTPQGFDPASPEPAHEEQVEVNLQAELEKYLQREEERVRGEQEPAAAQTPMPTMSPPEPTSYILDGTWSRDDARPLTPREAPSEPAGGRTGDQQAWPSMDELARQFAEDVENSPPASNWDPQQWPAEDEWPPSEKAG